MLEQILKQIELLPPLPQTVIEIEKFRKSNCRELDNLVDIIENDPLIVTSLLRIANSSMFGFKSKVETVKRAVNLLGIDFTIYVIIPDAIRSVLKINFDVYNISDKDFTDASLYSSQLINHWLKDEDKKLKDELIFSTFLFDIGKLVLSEVLLKNELVNEFKERLNQNNKICEIEKDLLNITTSKTSAEIMKYWQLDSDIVNILEFVDDVENCDVESKYKVQLLDIIKTACNACFLLTNNSINEALIKAEIYNMDKKVLEESINFVKSKVS